MNDILKEKILELLTAKSLKPNKLRKLIFTQSLALDQPDLTWTDFSNTLAAMNEDGLLSIETQSDSSQLCVLNSSQPHNSLVAKRSLDENASAKQTKKSKTDKRTEADREPQQGIQKSMSVPKRFIPFLLRQSGQKLKNIEDNTKTRIHCQSNKLPKKTVSNNSHSQDLKAPGTSLSLTQIEAEDQSDGEVDARLDGEVDTQEITIVGGEEKHVSAAEILIEAMLKAFLSNGKSRKGGKEEQTREKKKKGHGADRGSGIGARTGGRGAQGGKGKGERGKGTMGGRGKGAKGGRGKGVKGGRSGAGKGKGRREARETEVTEEQNGPRSEASQSTGNGNKKKRDRKYY